MQSASAASNASAYRPSGPVQPAPATPKGYRPVFAMPAQEQVHAPPGNIESVYPGTPVGQPLSSRPSSPVKSVFKPAASPTKAPKALADHPEQRVFTSSTPSSASRTGPPSPIKLQPTPGGIPRAQKVTKQTEDLLWPVKPYGHLLDVKSADDWAALRQEAGKETSLALHAAARARQNDYIIRQIEHNELSTHAALFHPEYEKNVKQRNVLMTRLIRDLKRTAYALECQTDAFVLAYVVSPHENPNAFERMDEDNTTVVRHTNPAGIQFKYRHVPVSHRINNALNTQWDDVYGALETTIKFQLVKPHLELWSTRRWAAGHAGTLTGSQQPFAEEDDDADVFLVPTNTQVGHGARDERLARARHIASQAARNGRVPLLPEHIASIAESTEHEITLIGIVAALDECDALRTLIREGHLDKLGALELLTSAAKDELNNFPATLLLSWYAK